MTLAATLALFLLPAPQEPGNVDLPRHPALSRDGALLTFSWRGDIWRVPASGGDATRLTSHPADEARSAFVPDGSGIVFDSDREGARNLWFMRNDGTGLRQITTLDTGSLALTAVGAGPDGMRAYFDASIEGDLYRSPRPYTVALQGGEPTRTHDAFGAHAVPDGSGARVLFERGGSSWLRRHYRGPDQREVWLFDRSAGAAFAFTQLTRWTGNDGHAHWAGADRFVFLSDRVDDTVNVYLQRLDGDEAQRLTRFVGEDVTDLAVSADGTTAAFVVWNRLYTLDLARGGEPKELTIRATEDFGDRHEHKDLANLASEAALSPDGKVMAVVAYGDVWVKAMDSKLPARRVTSTPSREKDLVWSADGESLFFTSDQSGDEDIWTATVAQTREDVKRSFELANQDERIDPTDAATPPAADQEKEQEKEKEKEKERPNRWLEATRFALAIRVGGETQDREPAPSPDGERLLFRRGRGDLCMLDLRTDTVTLLRAGWDPSIEYVWSPDGSAVAFAQNDIHFNKDIWIVPVDGSAAPLNVTRHPDNDMRPRFSADGKTLVFLSERTNEELDAWHVRLDKSLETMTDHELEQVHKQASEANKKKKPKAPAKPDEDAPPVPKMPAWDLDDAYLRVRRITSAPGNESNLEILPAGDRILVTTRDGMFTMKLDGSDPKKLASTMRVQGLSFSGDHAVGVGGGKAQALPLGGGDAKTAAIDATILVDKKAQNSQKFFEAARALGEEFYHPTMKGLDWPALSRRYHELALRTRTPDEFDLVANRFLGELNASHLGIRTPKGDRGAHLPQGRIGVRAAPVAGGFVVREVLAGMPAQRAKTPLVEGDVLTAVEHEPVDTSKTLESAFAGRVGRETIVSVRRTLPTGKTIEFDAFVEPVSAGQAAQQAYENSWRAMERQVHERSQGRIGYIHIKGMDQQSLDEFERGLYAATDGREGLLIDVRNNGGGWTADRLMASLTAQRHAYTVPRGQDPSITTGYPQDRLFIQRCILPANMLCNEKSFSNAEITSHAFKTLQRGTLVGQQTYGGVISTGGIVLQDGTTCRMPTRGWMLPDGTDMENHGAMPDLVVSQTPQDEAAGKAPQL